MSILPRFSHTSGAELEAHHVPQHIITFVEQKLERHYTTNAAQDQNGLRFPSAGDIHPDAAVDPSVPLPRPRKQRHLVLRLRLLRHPSPHKGRATPKPKPPARCKASMKANESIETPTPAHILLLPSHIFEHMWMRKVVGRGLMTMLPTYCSLHSSFSCYCSIVLISNRL